MKKVFKNPIFTFILGAVIFGGIGVVYAYVATAADVSYSPSDTSWSVSNVKTALDDLYTKSNNWVNPYGMDAPTHFLCDGSNLPNFTSPTDPPSGKKAYLALHEDRTRSVCIIRNNTQHCFRGNNYWLEKKHILGVFSDIICTVGSKDDYYICTASDIECQIFNNGDVYCQYRDPSSHVIELNHDGTGRCS